MTPPAASGSRPLHVLRLLLAGRPLLAAQQCGINPARLERASRIAGQQGGRVKRAARLGLYLTLRLGRSLPGGAWVAAKVLRFAPRLHDAALKRYVAYSSNAGDWQPVATIRQTMPGAHEAAILARLRRMSTIR